MKTFTIIVIIIVGLFFGLLGFMTYINRKRRRKNNWVFVLSLDKQYIRACRVIKVVSPDECIVKVPALFDETKTIIWDHDYNNWIFKEDINKRDPKIIGRNTQTVSQG